MTSRRVFAFSVLVLVVLATFVSSACSADDATKDDLAAIEFLATVDVYWYPEAQTVLVETLLNDPREEVRYAAVKALTKQLQRGKPPLDPTLGWRFPDPLIVTQIRRLGSFQKPLTEKKMLKHYSDHRFKWQQWQDRRRSDANHQMSNDSVIEALQRVAAEQYQENREFFEPSERIRLAAQQALRLAPPGTRALPQIAVSPETPSGEPTAPSFGFLPPPPEPLSYQPPPIPGRADTSNRLNLFDNMGPSPKTRVFFGYQFLQSQNNALFVTNLNERLFQNLTTAAGRAAFISFTGFGSGLGAPGSGGDVVINPNDPNSQQQLEDLYLQHNTNGVTRRYTQTPNTTLYRFGFEYALTLDFSVTMQAQYVIPTGDVEQPEMFSTPLIQLKHVLYRWDDALLSAAVGIAPQIPLPEHAIVEHTSRISPGLLGSRNLGERWFAQSATSFSLPTSSGNIKTWDYDLGLGMWLYRHESLRPGYKGPKVNPWLRAIVPQFHVLGKEIIGTNTVRGLFDLDPLPPRTADGTLSPVDGTRKIYLPQDPSIEITEVAIIYKEPRHVVDMTFATAILLRDQFSVTMGISFPVTGSGARATEFLMYVNRDF